MALSQPVDAVQIDAVLDSVGNRFTLFNSEPFRTLLVMAVPEHLSRDEIREMSRDLPPASEDDVPVTTDGVRLDTKEKVLEFLAQLERERQVGSAAGR